jgi:uncharacterized OsmC-like protein
VTTARDPEPDENAGMDLSDFGVRAGAGTRRLSDGVALDHPWTPEGVVAAPASNGAQLLHLSVALCVLNDTYREARRMGIEVAGVEVSADGGFDAAWRSTGIVYELVIDSPASDDRLRELVAVVDEVAEIPRALRHGAPVTGGGRGA